jgi:hypothetical protein
MTAPPAEIYPSLHVALPLGAAVLGAAARRLVHRLARRDRLEVYRRSRVARVILDTHLQLRL